MSPPDGEPARARFGAQFTIGTALFLRALGVIAAVAFVSLATQVRGLVGAHGILPAADFATRVAERYEGERFLVLPGLHWFFGSAGASDGALLAYCIAGAVGGIAVALGFTQGPALLACAMLYGTLASLSQVFLGYQWDILLVEVLVLASVLAPWLPVRVPIARAPIPNVVALIVVWLVVVRLEFGSGIAKLLGGDETWRDLTALTYHYETQCLPTWLGAIAHHAPRWFHQLECLVMYAVQLVAPIALFCGTWPRRAAVVALCALQIAIALTGNYTFFNWLSIGLTFACIDDAAFARIFARVVTRIPARFRVEDDDRAPTAPTSRAHAVRTRLRTALACLLGTLGLLGSVDRLTREPLPAPLDLVVDVARPFHLANGYALFASMTTERDEIELEALCRDDAARAADESAWRAYVFPHKPGPLDRAPDFTAPYQPRLDWQMWFAALGDARQSPWMVPLITRLLDAEPTVLALFERAPCGAAPPLALRATRYRYHLAPLGADAWWTRDAGAPFLPPRTR